MKSATAAHADLKRVGPARSRWLIGPFRTYAQRYVARHFHALRLARGGLGPAQLQTLAGPLVVVMNHPSWWDPMIGVVLTGLWHDRAHAAPIDAAGLAKYRFLERLGFFGIEPGTARGASAFLRQSLSLLDDPSGVLWITAQGRFADPRERPIRLKAGVGHLAHRLNLGTIVPLALEYPFWNERTPEALVRFGSPIVLENGGSSLSPGAWTARLEAALEANQEALAAEALSRDPTRFETFLAGRAGVGGVYDLWRRFRAILRGERFVADHDGE